MKSLKTFSILFILLFALIQACTTDENSSGPLPNPDPPEIKQDHLVRNAMEEFFPEGTWHHRYTDDQLMSSRYEFDNTQLPDSSATAEYHALFDFFDVQQSHVMEISHSDDNRSRISQSRADAFTIRWTWEGENLFSATMHESKSGWVHTFSTAAD